jgi:hypothetical protein
MYAIVENDKIIEWPIYSVHQRFPNISFPDVITQKSLPENVVIVFVDKEPEYDTATHKIKISEPQFISGNWTQTYQVIELSNQELIEQKAFADKIVETKRTQAYRNESDPLFFKSQRGEATHQEWLDKVAEIKARYQ